MLPGSVRMIMGHTIQQPGGINATCKGKAIRVDVGMSEGCGGAEAEILEIRKDREVWVVRAAEEAAGKPAKAHVLAGTEVPVDKHGAAGEAAGAAEQLGHQRKLWGDPAKAHVLAGTEVPADKHGFWGKLREAMGTRVA
ncbi:unnamed protein product [Closterium sp. NIES-64]|nr:unnamed protein product [Closterium sp. NIES-64]CAI6004646.1 unnamed protein product [Closterium sp. NIES-64]